MPCACTPSIAAKYKQHCAAESETSTTLPFGIALRNAGIETTHVNEIGMSEAEDAEIIQRAREDELVVVTLDAPFPYIAGT